MVVRAPRVEQPPQPPQPANRTVFLWPLPSYATSGHTTRSLAYPFTITAAPAYPDMVGAIARFNAIAFPHRATGDSGLHSLLAVTVVTRNINAPLQLTTDESYTLAVPADGVEAVIEANTYYGALHALETLSQLIYFNFSTSTYIIPGAPWRIDDSPRFPHRGVLVDTSRHYQTLPVIRRIIDSLAYSKYNVFHCQRTHTHTSHRTATVLR